AAGGDTARRARAARVRDLDAPRRYRGHPSHRAARAGPPHRRAGRRPAPRRAAGERSGPRRARVAPGPARLRRRRVDGAGRGGARWTPPAWPPTAARPGRCRTRSPATTRWPRRSCASRPCWDVTDVPEDRADDVRLRERLLAGDDDALAEAYDRWSTLVYSLAMRITVDHAAAEDVTQDVFVHLWQHPDRYDPQRGALRSWLCLLARSRALDWVRRRRAQDRYHAAAAAIAPMSAEVDDGVVCQAEAKAVREAVTALPDRQREAVVVAHYPGRARPGGARDPE